MSAKQNVWVLTKNELQLQLHRHKRGSRCKVKLMGANQNKSDHRIFNLKPAFTKI